MLCLEERRGNQENILTVRVNVILNKRDSKRLNLSSSINNSKKHRGLKL